MDARPETSRTLRAYVVTLLFLAAIAAALHALRREPSGEAEERLARGEAFEAAGKLEEAIAEYEQVSLTEDAGLAARASNRLSALHHRLGNLDRSAALARQALEQAREAENREGEAEALFHLGYSRYSLGRMREAGRLFQRSAEVAREGRLTSMEARGRLRHGMTAAMLEQKERARAAFERALELFRTSGDTQGEARAVQALGQLHSRNGETQEALERFEEARRLRETLGDAASEATLLNAIGQVYFDMGDKEAALEHYRQALRLNREQQYRRREAASLLEMGRCYLDLDNATEAFDHFDQALAIYRDLQNRRLEAAVLSEIGRVHVRREDYGRALEFFEKAVALKVAAGDTRERAYTLNEMGQVHLELSEQAKAREHFQDALALSRRADDPVGESLALFNLARASRAAGRLDDARSEVETSLAIVETLRARLLSHALRTSFFASVHDRYDFYTDLLLALDGERPGEGLDAEAFRVTERARARTFLENLGEAAAGIREGIEPELLEEERSLRRRLNEAAMEQLLRETGSDPEADEALSDEIEALTRDHDRLQARIRSRNPRYATLTQPEAVAIREVQSALLDEHTRLLSYALGAGRSFLWSVTRDDHDVYELPGRSELEPLARDVHALLSSPVRTKDGSSTIARLAEMLLGPVTDLVDEPRLAIVADGVLSRIPFSALPLPGQGVRAPPLVTELEIVRLPSASTLSALRANTTFNERQNWVAIAADPVYEIDDPRASAGASETVATLPATRELGFEPRRLPWSEREAADIAALAPPGKVDVVTGFDANREWVTEGDFRDTRILHLATHGFVDDQHPELSGIALSLVDERGGRRDGFLRLHEIYNLDLPVELVVLSACQTGLGTEVRGEGLLGLVRGFMYAGARRVVASAWNVDDRATAELMKRFYENLFDEMSASTALRMAQASMWRTPPFEAPYYWAGFELHGDWQ